MLACDLGEQRREQIDFADADGVEPDAGRVAVAARHAAEELWPRSLRDTCRCEACQTSQRRRRRRGAAGRPALSRVIATRESFPVHGYVAAYERGLSRCACSSSCTSCRCRRGRVVAADAFARGCGSVRASVARLWVPSMAACCWLDDLGWRRRASSWMASASTQVEPTKPSSSCSIWKTRSVTSSPTDVPHRLEHPHAFALVLDLGIDLGVAAEADAGAQVVHRQQVVFPGRVEDLQQQRCAPCGASRGGSGLRRLSTDCCSSLFAIEARRARRRETRSRHDSRASRRARSSLPLLPVRPSVGRRRLARRRRCRRGFGPRRPWRAAAGALAAVTRPAARGFRRAACS